MDTHGDLFACDPAMRRPILEDGKPAIFDFDLIDDKPIFTRPYPVPPKLIGVLEAKLQQFMDRGDIIQIESEYNNPILMVPHNSKAKNSSGGDETTYRLVMDLRRLNQNIKDPLKNAHLVKGVETLYPKVQGCKYMTLLDVNAAYKNLSASAKVMRYLAFRVPSSPRYGHMTLAFKSAIDGCSPVPGVWSHLMLKSLSPQSRKCTIVHIDDLLIHSPDLETHLNDVRGVFTDLL